MAAKIPSKVEVTPDPRTTDLRHRDFAVRTAIALGVATLFVVIGLTVYLASEVFVLAGAGLLIAVLLAALADFVAKWTPISRGWALTLILLLMVAGLGFGGWKLSASLSDQFNEMSASLAKSGHRIEDQLNKYTWGKKLVENAKQLQSAPGGNAELFGRFTRFFSSTLGGVFDAVIILFIGIYGAVDPATYRKGLIRLFPLSKRERAGEVVDKVGSTLRQWLLGQLLVMTTVGVVVTVGLWLLGVPFALPLGILAFFLEFVPYVGPIAFSIPGILVALSLDTSKALSVAIFYFVLQSAEGYLLSPLIQERAVKIPPALTVLAQVLLGVLVGGFGLILATPLTAVVLVLVTELYIKDALGERDSKAKR